MNRQFIKEYKVWPTIIQINIKIISAFIIIKKYLE